ncbi:trimethyllysine dioxygenase, mitochondrial-like isoform X2 [Musca autumnalis]
MHNRPFRKCALPQCSGLRFNLVHKFPRRKERLQQWLDAISSPRLNTLPVERLNLLWICCRHFRVEDYVNPQSKTLNIAAIPSLNLRNLDALDKCRQGDVEKATVLTDEEVVWLQETKSKDQLELLKSRVAITQQRTPAATSPAGGQQNNSVSSTSSTPPSSTCSVQTTISLAEAERILQRTPCCHTTSGVAPNTTIPPSPATIHTIPPSPTDSCTTTEDTTDFTLFLDDGYIEINDYKLGRTYELNSLWLRSLCHCAKCYDSTYDIPKINVFELSPDVQPIMANVADETTKLEIVWEDGHTSTYDLNKIYEKMQAKKVTNPLQSHILWSAPDMNDDAFQPLPCYDILMDINKIPTALRRLQRTGVLVVTSLPRSDTDSLLRRTLISKLFNHVWDNLISEKRKHFCATHTTPYTNCTFESMDKGLQMLTVPYHKENIKIKLCLVDGFNAAKQLQHSNKISYDFLSQYVLEYTFKDNRGYCHKTKQNIINLKDERIMFSPYHMTDLKAQDFDMIATHSKKFNELLKLSENQWHLELNSEMLIILDNFRICWCISEHYADNELDCLYMERRHFISSLHHQLK